MAKQNLQRYVTLCGAKIKYRFFEFLTVSYEILNLHTFGFFPVIPYDFLKNSLPLYVKEIPEKVQYRPALLGNPGDAELF